MDNISEDTTSAVPLNNVGNGSVDGIGTGLKPEPGIKKKKLRDIVMKSQSRDHNNA